MTFRKNSSSTSSRYCRSFLPLKPATYLESGETYGIPFLPSTSIPPSSIILFILTPPSPNITSGLPNLSRKPSLIARPPSLFVISDSFFYSYNHRHRSLVSSYIRYAVDCQVDGIELNFDVNLTSLNNEEIRSELLYDFHLCHLRNRSVKRLSLCHCELIVPSNDSIRFESLRVLEFDAVEFTDESLSELIPRCQNLESLFLHELRAGKRKFRIISESLKHLHLSNYFPMSKEEMESSIEIRTPNLYTISVCHFYVLNYIGDFSSVVEAKLFTPNMLLSFLFPKMESDEFVVLKRLKHMQLLTGYTRDDMLGLFLVLHRSPDLETLVLDYAYKTDKDASMIETFYRYAGHFEIPSVQELRLKEFRSTETEMLILGFFQLQAVALKKVVLVPAIDGDASQNAPIVLDPTVSFKDWIQVLVALKRNKHKTGGNLEV